MNHTAQEKRILMILDREARLRLFQQLHQNDDPTWYRAAGGCRCELCGLTYHEHPIELETRTDIDHRLCDGDVVHL